MTRARSERSRRPGAAALTLIGLLVVVLVGVGVLGWTIWGTDAQARSRATDQITALRKNWTSAPASAAQAGEGQVLGVISIPSLGLEWPIVAGVESSDLERGVGWYRSTAWPGEVGNTALAGLRITHGSPFRSLLDLAVGDEVIVETARATLHYRISVAPGDLTVDSRADWVLDPVPGHPQVAANQPLLTLTTAQDLVSSGDRSVAFATLVSRTDR